MTLWPRIIAAKNDNPWSHRFQPNAMECSSPLKACGIMKLQTWRRLHSSTSWGFIQPNSFNRLIQFIEADGYRVESFRSVLNDSTVHRPNESFGCSLFREIGCYGSKGKTIRYGASLIEPFSDIGLRPWRSWGLQFLAKGSLEAAIRIGSQRLIWNWALRSHASQRIEAVQLIRPTASSLCWASHWL
jgi:hypothetical protein